MASSRWTAEARKNYKEKTLEDVPSNVIRAQLRIYFTESFYPRTVRDWNTLPEDVLQSESAKTFTERVLDYLNNEKTNKTF